MRVSTWRRRRKKKIEKFNALRNCRWMTKEWEKDTVQRHTSRLNPSINPILSPPIVYLHISEMNWIQNKSDEGNILENKAFSFYVSELFKRWTRTDVFGVTTKSITPSSHSRALPFQGVICKRGKEKKGKLLCLISIFFTFSITFRLPPLEPFCVLKGNTWILFYLFFVNFTHALNSQERQSAHDENFSRLSFIWFSCQLSSENKKNSKWSIRAKNL